MKLASYALLAGVLLILAQTSAGLAVAFALLSVIILSPSRR